MWWFFDLRNAGQLNKKSCRINLPYTWRLAREDSLDPTRLWAMHWYRPASYCLTSVIIKLPPSTNLILRPSISKGFPSFFHITVGSGYPLGAPHCNKAVSPAATVVSTGTIRNSSLRTVTKKVELIYIISDQIHLKIQ